MTKENKKKILYVGGFDLPNRNAAAHRVLSIGKILSKIGYEVDYYGVDYTGDSVLYNEKFKNIIGCLNVSKSKKNYYTQIGHFITKITEYNIIIAYNYPAIPLMKLMKICKKNNILLIQDLTEWYSTKGMPLISKIAKGIDTFIRMRILAKKSNGLILISDYLYSYYKKHPHKILLPPLVDAEEPKWNKITEKKHEGKFTFVYFGNPGVNKDDLPQIVQYFSFLQRENVLLKVIGINEKDFNNLYGKRETKNVIFLGRMPHEKALQELMNSNISIIFRHNNRVTKAGFPTKFVESVTSSTPMLINNYLFIDKKYIGKNVYFADNIKDFDNIIDFIIGNFEAMKERAISCNKTFDYRSFVSLVQNFMKNILEERSNN